MKKIMNVVRKTCDEKRKISLQTGVTIRKRFKEKVIEMVDVGGPNLCGHLKDGFPKACDEVCGRSKKMRLFHGREMHIMR